MYGKDLYFASNSLRIEPSSLPELEQWVEILEQHSRRIKSVVVEGHTDDVGNSDDNLRLGFRRAAAVYRLLLEKGIPPEKLRVQTYGEEIPMVVEFDDVGRAKNRRVHLNVDYLPRE